MTRAEPNVFAQRLQQRLRELDRGTIWLSRRLNRHATTISAWLHGRSTPSVKEIERVALVLHRTPGWLLGEDEAGEIADDLVATNA